MLRTLAFALLLPGMALADSAHTGVMVETPMIAATPPNAKVAGGFVSLTNHQEEDDTLIAARISSDVAGMVQLHQMKMDGDVMQMSEIEGGINVPAGETITLQPGGLHIMLMQMPGGLAEGQTHEMTLVFEKAGEIEVSFEVKPRSMIIEMLGSGMKHGDGHSGHGNHSNHDS